MNYKSLLRKTFESIAVTHVLYFGGLSCLGLTDLFSPPVKNKSELEQLLKEEQEKLGIVNKNIAIDFCQAKSSFSAKLDDDTYLICIVPRQAVENIVSHEVYHIADGHTDTEYHFWRYIYLQEPQAMIYGSLGIEL